MSTWQAVLFGISGFCAGISWGKSQISDKDLTGQLSHMQDLVDQANERAYTWERRYDYLLSQIKEKTK